MAEFFSLEWHVRAGDYGITEVYDDDGSRHSVHPDDMLYMCLGALAMG